MFVDIALKTPKILTYSVPPPLCPKIKVGQIVLVPLGNKKAQGMIIDISSKSNFPKIRPIEKILTSKPFLFDYQIKMAQFIANYYCAPFPKAINLMIPPRINNEHSAGNLSLGKQSKPIYFWSTENKQKEKFYWQEIKKCLDKEKQIILLYPKINLHQSFINYLLSYSPQKITLLSSRQTNKELQEDWQAINKGIRKIIIGSQKPLFMPYNNLGLIIVNEEQDSLYKQDRSPRYHTTKVALELARLTGAKIILSTSAPSITSYYKVKKNCYHLIKDKKQTSMLSKIDIINLGNLPYSERIISPFLKKELDRALAQKKQIILFLNRKGTARSIICSDCGQTINCSSCDLPMLYYKAKKPYLWCHRCNKKQEVPDVCPKCLSLFITERGLGIGTIKKELKKFYPLTNIELFDSDVPNIDRVLTNYLAKKTSILIGTQIILNYPDLKTDLLGIISADTELYFPDFESEPKTFFLLTSLLKITAEKTIIQSYNPDFPSIKYALKNDFEGFYKTEIQKRKLFAYPPFTQIIKLTIKDKNNQKCQDQANKLKKELILLTCSNSSIIIIGPAPAYIFKTRGLYHWQIIIKLNLKNYKFSKEHENFKKELVKLSLKNLTYEVDPKTLI